MGQRLTRKVLQIDGMTCSSCEMRIEKALGELDGVIEIKAVFSSSNVYITYDANAIELDQIIEVIEKQDYTVKNKPGSVAVSETARKSKAPDEKMSINQLLAIGIILLALYVIVINIVGFDFIPEINQAMGYGVLFVVGLLTSLHCISMCGGINLSQSISYRVDNTSKGKLSVLKPSLLYNSGRVVSYTIIGGIVGAIGSIISFSGAVKGIVAVVSGIFMVIMGLNMLNIFPWLRKINLRMPKILGKKLSNNKGKYSPFYVGLLNGLMPCGPLQAMQIYALGTGSFTSGALSMFMFSIGTVPLMFGLGAISTLLNNRFSHKMMKVSAMLVIVLGLAMASRGLALSGLSFPSVPFGISYNEQGSNIAIIQDDVQIVKTKLSPGRYEPIIVQKGIPVKWVIQARDSDINGCNNEIIVPKFSLEKKLKEGDNTIEFTPIESGTFAYSCWMGMIRSKITVVDDINSINASDPNRDSAKSVYKIPTDVVAVATIKNGRQYVEINMEKNGLTPAVVVMQRDIETIWNIKCVNLNDYNSTMIFPKYNEQISLQEGDNEIIVIPSVDFDFSSADSKFYGYVKVVDNIDIIDIEAIKKEVSQYIPTMQDIIDYSELPSCH